MFNIFEIAMNDQAIYYLGQLFGPVGSVLPGSGPALLGVLFKVFNTVLLALGAFIIVYSTVVGVLKTAQEGEFLGKQWGSMWTPIRMVLGIAGLVPLTTSGGATGYCAIQVIMMWVIVQGIGAADTLWTTTLKYINSGGATAPSTVSQSSQMALQAAALQNPQGPLQPGLSAIEDINNLFTGLVCQATAKASYSSSYYCYYYGGNSDGTPNSPASQIDPFCQISDSDMLNVYNPNQYTPPAKPGDYGTYNLGPKGSCGSLQVADITNTNPVMNAEARAFQTIIPTLGAIASEMVSTDHLYRDFVESNPNTPVNLTWLNSYCAANPNMLCNAGGFYSTFPPLNIQNPPAANVVSKIYWPYVLYPYTGNNFIYSAYMLYNGLVGNAMNTSATSAISTSNADANGWILAGAFYYQIANVNQHVQQMGGTPLVTLNKPFSNQAAFKANPEIQNSIRVILDSIPAGTYALLTEMKNEQAKGAGGMVNTPAQNCSLFPYFPGMGDLCNTLINDWMGALTGSSGSNNVTTNPIVKLQTLGESLLIDVQLVFAGILLIVFTAQSIASVMSSVQGEGYALSEMFNFMLIPLMFLLGAIFVFAATLAVYIPFIPYMLFTFGALNWFIATIETMIAAPIVALAILMPHSGHEVWGRASPAFMLILNVFLRPSLMILGMMTAMLMSYVIIDLINAAFLGVVNQVSPNMSGGALEIILFIMLYTFIILTALNKTFALIHLVPDQVLRWIGGRETFGDSNISEIERGFGTGAGIAKAGTEGAIRTVRETSQKITAARNKRLTKQAEEQKGLSINPRDEKK